MNVLVVGCGNIGTTLTNLILECRSLLSIEKVWVLRNTQRAWQNVDIDLLKQRGALICTRTLDNNAIHLSEIENLVDYVFDCASSGTACSLKEYYDCLPRLKGACAQGSEKKFGIPFMTGVNPQAILGQRFVNIVSCNTHGAASILQTFAGLSLEQLIEADIVAVRRSEDISAHQRLVTSSVVARHLHPAIGTHHAIDVVDLFKTIGTSPMLTSSDVTTPSQLMHAARFNIVLDHAMSLTDALEKAAAHPFISTTIKFDSNKIFELGRRYGFQGRIFEHAILVENNLLINDNTIKGWVFVPQEGNTILSTLDAFLLQTNCAERERVFTTLQQKLLMTKW